MPIDIEKSLQAIEESTDKETYTVRGWGSTPSLDLQNDIVDPKGIDISYFVSSGYINAEHNKERIIGYPTSNCYVDPDRGLFVEAKLFKSNQYAREFIELAESLEKSGSGRKIGFSIEGSVKKRNINDTRIIEEVMITGMAVCRQPANPSATIDTILKSFLTGHGISPSTQEDGGALRRESLATSISNLTYTTRLSNSKTKDDLWKGIIDELTRSDRMGYEESVITLQLAKGLSRKDAELAVLEIKKNKINGGNIND